MVLVFGLLIYFTSSINCRVIEDAPSPDNFEVVLKSACFVDKSGFIREFLTARQPLYVTAPRGFGKSTTLNMLRKFAGIETDVNGTRINKNNTSSFNLFLDKRLEVTKDKKFFNDHFGQYPVLLFRLKYVLVGNSRQDFERFFRAVIVVAAKEHAYLSNSTKLTKDERELYDTIYKNDFKKSPEAHAKDLTSLLHTHHKRKCLVLIDDFDSSLSQILSNEHISTGDVGEILNLLQRFLSSLMHHNEHLENGLVTGCVRMAPAHSSPETLEPPAKNLNGLRTVVFGEDEKLSQYFGYTDNEVLVLARKFSKDQYMDGIRRWYGGYAVLKSKLKLFNMFSVSRCLETGNFTLHWTNEDDIERLKYMFDYKIIGDEVQKSLTRGTIRVMLNSHFTTVFTVEAVRTLAKELNDHRKSNFTSQIHHTELFLKYLIDHGYYSAWHESKTVDDRVISATIPNNEAHANLDGFIYSPFFYQTKYNIPSESAEAYIESVLNLTEAETGYTNFAVSLSHLYSYVTQRVDATEILRLLAVFADYSEKFDMVLREILTDKTQGVNLVFITKTTPRIHRTGIVIRLKVEESSAYAALSEIIKHNYHDIFKEKFKKVSITNKILIGVHLSSNKTCSLSYLDNSVDLQDVRNATSDQTAHPHKLVQGKKESSFETYFRDAEREIESFFRPSLGILTQ